MDVYRGLADIRKSEGRSVLTMGNFDGVHIGHQALLSRTTAVAGEAGARSIAMTFDPHPIQVFRPGRFNPLQTLDERLESLAACGLDAVLVMAFNEELANTSARNFVTNILIESFDLAHLVLGFNTTFGRRAEGSVESMVKFGREFDFPVEIFPPFLWKDEPVSSTRIRNALIAGDCPAASEMLGAPFAIGSIVVEGHKRGRQLGFPTANLGEVGKLVPRNGVYAAWCSVGGERHRAAVNVGTNPTFGSNDRTIEAHILNFDKDIYGEHIELEFVERCRGEMKFDSVDDLVAQMHKDVEWVRGRLD